MQRSQFRCLITRVMLAAFLVSGLASRASAQESVQRTAGSPNVVQLFVEPVALGAQLLGPLGPAWNIGVSAGAGPLFGVTLRDADVQDVRSWAGAYAVLAYRTPGAVQLHVSPIGAALAVGNDFAAVYPSGQAGIDIGWGRLRVGSLIRVIRIAGPNGTGTYWTQWVPLRVAYVLR